MYSTTHSLCLHNLSFERNYKTLLSKLNFNANPGDIIQILGHNGCGKSTLLRILAGFITPHHGKITWNGLCIFRHRETYIENLAYLGHLNGIKPSLSVYENLSLNLTLTGRRPLPQALYIIIKKVGLNAFSDSRTQDLSAGQVRRLCLARLMLSHRQLWLLDEPSTALDNAGQVLLNELLQEHIANNGIAIIATHQGLKLGHTIKTISLGEHDAI